MNIGIPQYLESVQLPSWAWLCRLALKTDTNHLSPCSMEPLTPESEIPLTLWLLAHLCCPLTPKPYGLAGALTDTLSCEKPVPDRGWDYFLVGVLYTMLYLEVLPGKAAVGREHEEGEGPQLVLWGSHV